jgi:hypothetical protein
VRDFGWEIAHAAVSRRPPISLYTMVVRTGSYAYDVGVWDLSLVRAIFCRPAPNLSVTIRNFFIAVWEWWCMTGAHQVRVPPRRADRRRRGCGAGFYPLFKFRNSDLIEISMS